MKVDQPGALEQLEQPAAVKPNGLRLGYSALSLVVLSAVPKGKDAISLRELESLLSEKSVKRQRFSSYLPILERSGLVELCDTDEKPGVMVADKGRAYVAKYADRLPQAQAIVNETSRFRPATYNILSLIERKSDHPGGWLMEKDSKISPAKFLASELGLAKTTAENRLHELAQRKHVLFKNENIKLTATGHEWLVATREIFPEKVKSLEGGVQKALQEEALREQILCMTREINHMMAEIHMRNRIVYARDPEAVDMPAKREELIKSRVNPETFVGLSSKELSVEIKRLEKQMVGLEIDIARAISITTLSAGRLSRFTLE